MAMRQTTDEGDKPSQQTQLPGFSHFLSGVSRSDASEPSQLQAFHQVPHHVHSYSLSPIATTRSSQASNGPIDQSQSWHRSNNDSLRPQLSVSPALSQSSYGAGQQSQQPLKQRSQSEPNPERELTDLDSKASLAHILQPRARTIGKEQDASTRALAYGYEDGSTCQKPSNGALVNPVWGTTKAGKPRKRLGQACQNCREKKIKCDPGYPRCTQCQKFDRECKFDVVSQRKQAKNSRPMSPAIESPRANSASDGLSPRSDTDAMTDETTDKALSSSRSSMNLDAMLAPRREVIGTSDEKVGHKLGLKKARLSNSTQSDTVSPTPLLSTASSTKSHSTPLTRLQFEKDVDPYTVDAAVTEYYIHEFFSDRNIPTSTIFPRKAFLAWVRTCKTKSEWDITLLYAMLALGSTLARTKASRPAPASFADIAMQSLTTATGVLKLQIAQAKIILSTHFISVGEPAKVWELGNSAMHTACALGLNTESNQQSGPGEFDVTYGFDESMLRECRRRTFWICFTLDCHSRTQTLLLAQRVECYLRLPCLESEYEKGHVPGTPFFDKDLASISILLQQSTPPFLGQMALLCHIAYMWNTIVSHAYKSTFEGFTTEASGYEIFYTNTRQQLHAWDQLVVAHYKGKADDSKLAVNSHASMKLSGLHVLYHYCGMALNRYRQYSSMRPSEISRNVQEVYQHAHKILEIASHLVTGDAASVDGHEFAAASPHTALAILHAVDIVTAAGMFSDFTEMHSKLMTMIYNAIEVLDHISEYWSVARTGRELIKSRIQSVLAAAQEAPSLGKFAFFVREPMERNFQHGHDIVYGLPRAQYLQLLPFEGHVHSEEDFFEIRGRPFEAKTSRGIAASFMFTK